MADGQTGPAVGYSNGRAPARTLFDLQQVHQYAPGVCPGTDRSTLGRGVMPTNGGPASDGAGFARLWITTLHEGRGGPARTRRTRDA